jgi:hypothetical protein
MSLLQASEGVTTIHDKQSDKLQAFCKKEQLELLNAIKCKVKGNRKTLIVDILNLAWGDEKYIQIYSENLKERDHF